MLSPPPSDFAKHTLETRTIRADQLFRISRYSRGEPFFGRSAAFRFDDNRVRKSSRFGTCYCGFDLETAIAETLLHDEIPVRGKFKLSRSDFDARQLVRFAHSQDLTVANLTGLSLKRAGGSGSISTILPYNLPQQWARAVHRHKPLVDGIVYVSRHLNDREAVVIFDRAKHKIARASYTPLKSAPGIVGAIAALGLTFPYP